MRLLEINSSTIPNILSLVIASINFIFPSKLINKAILKTDDTISMKESYEDIRW